MSTALNDHFMLRKHFLLVDDDWDDQTLFAEALKDIAPDCICSVADDGYEAVKYLSSATPDCIITDINMPKLGGLDLARIITKELELSIPIIVWSTKPPDHMRVHGIGIIATFSKPYGIQDLYAFVEQVLSLTASCEAHGPVFL